MQLYSTKDKEHLVSLKQAVLQGLPPDNGLYMPVNIPRMSDAFFRDSRLMSFQELAYHVSRTLLQGAIPDADLKNIIESAVNFDAPLVQLDRNTYILELFHGPSLAFKDFGARFMAQLMSYFTRDDKQDLYILVATSGDTGGAVAHGFHNTPGIHVVILYPQGRVSMLQEKQLTTLEGNVTALEVDGSFDDCQSMVKQAFLDQQLRQQLRLSSANSINISRLIPQMFYYFRAWQQLDKEKRPIVFSIPSGNFGNLTAGLFAKKMGLPVAKFVAATNLNDVVPHYLSTGQFIPKSSVATISNAMDVGNPSNFARMLDLYHLRWSAIRNDISGYAFNDEQTRECMSQIYDKHSYIIDPHGALGYLAWRKFQEEHPQTVGVILETAHPAKFLDVVEPSIDRKVPVPERLASLEHAQKKAHPVSTQYEELKSFLLSMAD